MITFKMEHNSFTNDPEITVEYTVHNESSLSGLIQEFRRFLLAAGYQPESVNGYIEAE